MLAMLRIWWRCDRTRVAGGGHPWRSTRSTTLWRTLRSEVAWMRIGLGHPVLIHWRARRGVRARHFASKNSAGAMPGRGATSYFLPRSLALSPSLRIYLHLTPCPAFRGAPRENAFILSSLHSSLMHALFDQQPTGGSISDIFDLCFKRYLDRSTHPYDMSLL